MLVKIQRKSILFKRDAFCHCKELQEIKSLISLSCTVDFTLDSPHRPSECSFQYTVIIAGHFCPVEVLNSLFNAEAWWDHIGVRSYFYKAHF